MKSQTSAALSSLDAQSRSIAKKPTAPPRLSIYERGKQQLAARDLKVESLRRALESDFTFKPSTGRAGKNRRQPGSNSSIASVCDRLYHKNGTTMSGGLGAKTLTDPCSHSGSRSSPISHRNTETSQSSSIQVSHRLESLYKVGVFKLLQRPKNERDEKAFRDRRYEEKQLAESLANREAYGKTSALPMSSIKMLPKTPKISHPRQHTLFPLTVNSMKLLNAPSPNGPVSPPPLRPKCRGNLLFPSEVFIRPPPMVNVRVVPRQYLQLRRAEMAPPHEPWPQHRTRHSDPWCTPLPVAHRRLPWPTPDKSTWRSRSPKPWHTPQRTDGQITKYVDQGPGLRGTPDVLSESTDEWRGAIDADADSALESATATNVDNATEYGSI